MYGADVASGGCPSMIRILTWSWIRGLPYTWTLTPGRRASNCRAVSS